MLNRATVLRVALLLVSGPAVAVAQSQVAEMSVDAIFSKWTTSTPGCAVGVAVRGKPVLLKAYGMADLEHEVRNTPETIFESGSVAKQFTAMAILLLAQDGRLSLDDQVRKHIPELPDYGVPLTIRHMLTHTSGLRDWGSVASIAGWPRTTRAYTHAHVLEIVSRQKSLNFPPGTEWSYSNTGFNLAAIIVDRVSGMSFAEFSRRRIFEPLGMTHTSWRDDHRRIVKGRATAYSTTTSGYEIEMPFEHVHGNGGLLTTVGDLLKWNENYVTPKVGDAALVAEQQKPGKYNDGRDLDYALGLYVRPLDDVKNVYHSGSTAGYRAHLNRFPQSHTSVAVLCNGSDGNATNAANAVSRLYLGQSKPSGIIGGSTTGATGIPAPSHVTATDPKEFVGDYWSDEAETKLTAMIDKGRLVLRRRPGILIELEPIGKDTFRGQIGTVTFRRNASGAVEALSIKQERVWDLRFPKASEAAPR
jgi:CubicO group peptidase (beta-lactamase class C family)